MSEVIEVEAVETIVETPTTLDKVKGFVIKHKAGIAIVGSFLLGAAFIVATSIAVSREDVFESDTEVDEIIEIETI